MILFPSVVVLALTAALANAQNGQNATYLNGLLQALNNAGLTTLATAVGFVNSTGAGNQLLATLSNQKNNYTILAPNNDAFSRAPGDITQDPDKLTNAVSYHVVFGHFVNTTTFPNTTIGRTALGDSSVVMLEGNKNQVVAWSKRSDGQLHVLNQQDGDGPQVTQKTSYENLDIYVINSVLDYPGDINSTFKADGNFSGFASLARDTDVPIWDNGDHANENATVSEVLYGIRGLTLLVPSNQASAQGISGNSTRIWNILRNHIINGTTVYSPSLANATYISAGGQYLHFRSNSSGKFVTSGDTTAQILKSDVLVKNGVFHVIDRVLVNPEVNEEVADNAYESATELAGHSSTETGPVGVPTGGSSGGIGGNGAVGKLEGVGTFGIAALCVILGSSFLFA